MAETEKKCITQTSVQITVIDAANNTFQVSAPLVPAARAPACKPSAQIVLHPILTEFEVSMNEHYALLAKRDSTIASNAESGAAGPSAVHVDASEQLPEAPSAIQLRLLDSRSTCSAGENATESIHM